MRTSGHAPHSEQDCPRSRGPDPGRAGPRARSELHLGCRFPSAAPTPGLPPKALTAERPPGSRAFRLRPRLPPRPRFPQPRHNGPSVPPLGPPKPPRPVPVYPTPPPQLGLNWTFWFHKFSSDHNSRLPRSTSHSSNARRQPLTAANILEAQAAPFRPLTRASAAPARPHGPPERPAGSAAACRRPRPRAPGPACSAGGPWCRPGPGPASSRGAPQPRPAPPPPAWPRFRSRTFATATAALLPLGPGLRRGALAARNRRVSCA